MRKWNNIFYVRMVIWMWKKFQQENKTLIKTLTEIIQFKTVKHALTIQRKENRPNIFLKCH
jgi:hypothetical protein